MLYRKLGRTGVEVSVLGFGCMRLPLLHVRDGLITTLEQNKELDEEQATGMIHHAIAHGINYFDTAYPYHEGRSEPLLGKTVKGYREKVMLATKLPVWLIKNEDDFDRYFNEQLERLNTDYLDVYLLHGLNRKLWDRVRELRVLDALERVLAGHRKERCPQHLSIIEELKKVHARLSKDKK